MPPGSPNLKRKIKANLFKYHQKKLLIGKYTFYLVHKQTTHFSDTFIDDLEMLPFLAKITRKLLILPTFKEIRNIRTDKGLF